MAFTEDQDAKIRLALGEKTKLPCPSCGSRSWQIAPDIVLFQLEPNPAGPFVRGGATLPAVVTVCMVCGNTQFYNAYVLGLAKILGLMEAVKNG